MYLADGGIFGGDVYRGSKEQGAKSQQRPVIDYSVDDASASAHAPDLVKRSFDSQQHHQSRKYNQHRAQNSDCSLIEPGEYLGDDGVEIVGEFYLELGLAGSGYSIVERCSCE